tara:strand:+ start:163 stop:549 length:387 start_codon:yes stop_codon:yes gene_type:complete
LTTANSKKNYRWVILRHTGAPDDLRGLHFDLLLEDKECCRTWRLSDIPLLDGPYVDAVHIASHDLDWLEINEKVVSGNRGIATRIKKGVFLHSLPKIEKSLINLSLKWDSFYVDLVIDKNGCRILSKK